MEPKAIRIHVLAGAMALSCVPGILGIGCAQPRRSYAAPAPQDVAQADGLELRVDQKSEPMYAKPLGPHWREGHASLVYASNANDVACQVDFQISYSWTDNYGQWAGGSTHTRNCNIQTLTIPPQARNKLFNLCGEEQDEYTIGGIRTTDFEGLADLRIRILAVRKLP